MERGPGGEVGGSPKTGRAVARPGLTLIVIVLALLLTLTPAPPARAQSRVEAILAEMTLEEKVGQMFMSALFGAPLNEPGRLLLEEWKPGSAVLFNSNAGDPAATTRLINQWQSAVVGAGGVPMFITTDQEGGVISRLKDGFTTLPAMMLVTATGDVSLAYRTGETLGRELSAVGVNMNLGPVADLYTNLRNPIIGRRSFGSEPELTGQMLAALIRGMQANGVLATAKHFPGHGDTEQDSHTSLPTVDYARDELDRVELAPFRWTVAAGVEAVMVAHIWYPAYDPDEEIPASLSYNVVTGLLREELGFTGLVMTDAIEMDAIDLTYSYPEASVRAVLAGVDIIAFGANLSPSSQISAMSGVVEAVRSGRIPESRIDESVRRILNAKARYGILDWQPLDPDSAPQRVDSPVGSELVRDLFNAGVTVAYDQTGAIPLDPSTRRVSVIYPASRPSIRQSCEAAGGAGITWLGVAESPSQDDIARAVTTARNADIAVVFTSNAAFDPTQQALVQALPPDKTVAVALFSPFDWMSFPGVTAYITTYSPLPEAVPAACAVLFGSIPANGRLPVALDGARDFVNGGAALPDGGALSLLPRRAPGLADANPDTDALALVFTPPASETPISTPTAAPTSAPLDSTRRAPPNTPTPTVPPTAIALILPPTPPPSGSTPLVGEEPAAPPDIGMWLVLGVLIGGVGLVVVGVRTIKPAAKPTSKPSAPRKPSPPRPEKAATVAPAERPPSPEKPAPPKPERPPVAAPPPPRRVAFFLSRCVVCHQTTLEVKDGQKLVRCTSCHSLLRPVGSGRWMVRVNRNHSESAYDELNDKTFTEAELRRMER
ncbi:MAG: glycoside hydrolase family 3 protein [Anaerolineae bacterium]|jgi:beta-N-acetylhexosaminidase|nr:glycoside hydrolase family 3 protein [Anaerolineae bacterium]